MSAICALSNRSRPRWRLMAKTYSRREILRQLTSHGYAKMKGRGKGSHEMFQLGSHPPINVPYGKDLRIGTAKGILNSMAHQVAESQTMGA